MGESYTCKILGVLETDPNDPQIATKIAIDDPMGAEGVSPTLMFMDTFIAENSKNRNANSKAIYKAVLEALLDLRLRLPPIYNFSPSNILVDTKTFDVKIIVNDNLFVTESEYLNLPMEGLVTKSPEELHGKGRSLTTPFWVMGCLLFEARFGFNPFVSHLKPEVTEMFIKYYPVMFPED